MEDYEEDPGMGDVQLGIQERRNRLGLSMAAPGTQAPQQLDPQQQAQAQQLAQQMRQQIRQQQPFTQASSLYLQRLNAGLAAVEQQENEGSLHPDPANHLRMQLMSAIQPLQQRQQMEQDRQEKQQVHAAMKQQSVTTAMEMVDAKQRAKAFPETVGRVLDPLTGHVAEFAQTKPGHFTQVKREWMEPVGGEEALAGGGDFGTDVPLDEEERKAFARHPEMGLDKPAETPKNQMPVRRDVSLADAMKSGRNYLTPEELTPAPTNFQNTMDRDTPWPEAQVQGGPRLDSLQYHPVTQRVMPFGKFDATEAQQAVMNADRTRGRVSHDVYNQALEDRRAQERGLARDPNRLTQGAMNELWDRANNSVRLPMGAQRTHAVGVLYNHLIQQQISQQQLESRQAQQTKVLEAKQRQQEQQKAQAEAEKHRQHASQLLRHYYDMAGKPDSGVKPEDRRTWARQRAREHLEDLEGMTGGSTAAPTRKISPQAQRIADDAKRLYGK